MYGELGWDHNLRAQRGQKWSLQRQSLKHLTLKGGPGCPGLTMPLPVDPCVK